VIVRCVLLVAVMATLVTPAVLVTAGVPAAGDVPDAPVLRLEHRSRGPPAAAVRLARPTVRSSVLSARSRIASNICSITRRPGTHENA